MQMSKAHLILLCEMMVLPGSDCLGVEAPTLNAEQLKQVVLFAPKPYFAVPQTQSVFHPRAKLNAFRRRDVRLQSRSAAPWESPAMCRSGTPKAFFWVTALARYPEIARARAGKILTRRAFHQLR
jgi:hypothetical protein